MALLPLYGHEALRQQFEAAIARGALPPSLLIQGPRGVGKQRLALWLSQRLLCRSETGAPCGQCESCRYTSQLAHPDVRWFFPRPRLADSDASVDDVLADYESVLAERARNHGLYAPASGLDGLFVSTVRAIVRLAALTPSLAKRKVFVLGDAERMAPGTGDPVAANAFLKLLEEPPLDTTLILTSSEPGALLPTIRSRVVAFRAKPLADKEMRAFLADPRVQNLFRDVDTDVEGSLRAASGSPGLLLDAAARREARQLAKSLLAAVRDGRAEQLRAALGLGGSKARGLFSDVLDELMALLHERGRNAARRLDADGMQATAQAIDVVDEAKLRAAGNINPQLLGASMLRELGKLLG